MARLVRQRRRCHEQVDHVGQHHCASVDAQQQLPVIRIRFPQSHPRNLIPALSYSLPHTLRTTPPFFTCVIEHRPPVSVSRFLYRAGSRTVFHINPRLSHPLMPPPHGRRALLPVCHWQNWQNVRMECADQIDIPAVSVRLQAIGNRNRLTFIIHLGKQTNGRCPFHRFRFRAKHLKRWRGLTEASNSTLRR